MQTTIRIDQTLYREVEAAAACEGVTPTRFIESALRLRLSAGSWHGALPIFDSGVAHALDVLLLIETAQMRSR